MLNITCPFCQELVDFAPLINPDSNTHRHQDFTMRYYPLIDEYQIDIKINQNEYGFDSSKKANQTFLFLLTGTEFDERLLLTLNYFTPPPANIKDLEQLIHRLLNIKAFS